MYIYTFCSISPFKQPIRMAHESAKLGGSLRPPSSLFPFSNSLTPKNSKKMQKNLHMSYFFCTFAAILRILINLSI